MPDQPSIEEEPSLEDVASRIRRGGYTRVVTSRPQGPGDISELVWQHRRVQTLDLDWYRLVERFGYDWPARLARLLQ